MSFLLTFVFSLFYLIFPRFEANLCEEAGCGLLFAFFPLVLKAFQLVLGSWNPEFTIVSPENGLFGLTLRFKGKITNLEAKNTVKLGEKHQKDKWFHFRACRGGGWVPRRRGREVGRTRAGMVSAGRRGGVVCGQNGVDFCHFPRALPASICGPPNTA